MSFFNFGQQECQHCRNWWLYTANIPRSAHLLCQISLTNLFRTLQFPFLLNFRIPRAFLGSMVSSCNLRIEFSPVFHHPFDRQSLGIFRTGCTREKCHVEVKFGSFADLNFGYNTGHLKTRKLWCLHRALYLWPSFFPFWEWCLSFAQPVISLDAAHLRREYRGTLYMA